MNNICNKLIEHQRYLISRVDRNELPRRTHHNENK